MPDVTPRVVVSVGKHSRRKTNKVGKKGLKIATFFNLWEGRLTTEIVTNDEANEEVTSMNESDT